MELFSRGQNGSDSGGSAYGIDIGPHKMAAACFLSDEMADLIVASANVFVLAARDLNVSPLGLAKMIGGNLQNIGKALVWGQEGLNAIHDEIEAQGYEWDPEMWDSEKSIHGHALVLIKEALECFPKIKFVQPVDEQADMIKQLVRALEFRIEKEDLPELALIGFANKLVGDQ